MRESIHVEVTQEPLVLISDIAYTQVPYWYGAGSQTLYLHLLRPKHRKEPRPLVLWFCGGAYAVMDKSLHCLDMKYLVQHGYIVASVQYRTFNDAGFPAPVEDAKAAIRYLRAHADQFGIDPAHVAVMGESAGGHLAVMTALMQDPALEVGDWKDVSSRVQAVVDWYGPTRWFLPENAKDPVLDGASAKVPSKNALDYLTPDAPPFMILHGECDTLVPLAQSEELYDALIAQETDAELYVIQNAGHGDVHFTQPEMEARIVAFLDTHLKEKK